MGFTPLKNKTLKSFDNGNGTSIVHWADRLVLQGLDRKFGISGMDRIPHPGANENRNRIILAEYIKYIITRKRSR
jgi:hypothetical protein